MASPVFTPRYCLGVEGSSLFVRAAADAQSEVMEPFFDAGDWEYAPHYFQELPALLQQRRPTALGGLELFGVVIGFIATCFAKKIFDEIYDRSLKRPIAAQLDRIFAKLSVPAGKIIEYRDVIYLADIDLVVVVRAIASREATRELQSQVMQAHCVAHSYIKQHGRKAPIHCHRIERGLISVEPELFNTMEEIRQHDRAELKALPRK